MTTCGRDDVGRDAMLDIGIGTSSLLFVLYIPNISCCLFCHAPLWLCALFTTGIVS